MSRFAAVLHEISLTEGAIKDVASVARSLEHTVENSFVKRAFKETVMVFREEELLIRGTPFKTFFNLFKKGAAQEALRVLTGPTKSIAKSAINFFKREARAFPEFHLAQAAPIEEALNVLKKDVTILDLEKTATASSRVKSALEVVSSKVLSGKFIGFSLTVSAVGLTVYELTDRYREQLTGCFRYETRPDGSISVCKVTNLSCSTATKARNTCSINMLTPDQQKFNCVADNTQKCRMCDSTVTNESDPNYIPDRKSIPLNVKYKCRRPDFAEALADMTQTYVTTVADEVADIANTGKNIFKYVIWAVIVLVGVIVIYTVYRIFSNFWGSSNNSNYSYQPLRVT